MKIYLAMLSSYDTFEVVGAYSERWRARAIASVAEQALLDKERIECLAFAREQDRPRQREWWLNRAKTLRPDGTEFGVACVVETELVT